MKKYNSNIFVKILSIITIMMVLPFMCNNANGADTRVRASSRATATVARRRPIARQSVTTTQQIEPETTIEEPEEIIEPEPLIIDNKTTQFDNVISTVSESSLADDNDSEFAEQIRRQRNALLASESTNRSNLAMQNALNAGVSTCDTGLRQCMQKVCGNDFTKCALDGDTDFGNKLNKCRRETDCTGEEFTLFTKEIKADRDLNVQLQSYTSVIECGNQYNSCIQNECGATFNKCLGKTAQDRAIKACEKIAKNCTEQDSGLSQRVGNVIGILRVNAEKDVKTDEQRLYDIRDLMRSNCQKFGAMFDERSFDCVYTVNFFTGENQQYPTASRKRYAGDTFICMQEWFGINATTFKENAYRETRSQTAASSAMLGSGVGTATGLITSGAINRAIDTQKAKKELDEERILQGKPTLKEEENARKEEIKEKKAEKKAAEKEKKDAEQKQKEDECRINRGGNYVGGVCYCKGVALLKGEKCANNHIVGRVCTIKNATMAKYDENGVCVPSKCIAGYKPVNVGGWYCGVDQDSTVWKTK